MKHSILKLMICGTSIAFTSAACGSDSGLKHSNATFTGTVPAAPGTRDVDLPALAKISLLDSINAAVAAQPGTAIEASLDDERGFVVYTVEIMDANKVVHELTIDAGNGTVLRRAIDD